MKNLLTTRLLATCVAGVGLIAVMGLSPARASFVQIDTDFADSLNLNKSTDVSSFSGTAVTINDIGIATVGNVNTASGNATITPIKGTLLTSLIFTPVNADLFSAFSFRGQLVGQGNALETFTLTVQDDQGHLSQTFTYTNQAHQDFGPFGIHSLDGETIKSLTFASTTGFFEEKQFTFGATAVP